MRNQQKPYLITGEDQEFSERGSKSCHGQNQTQSFSIDASEFISNELVLK